MQVHGYLSRVNLHVCVDGVSVEFQCFEIKTEADSNDITQSLHDDKPSTGMFAVSDVFMFSAYDGRSINSRTLNFFSHKKL